MLSLDMRTRIAAASLSGLAGYVDAVGFLGSGGFFVSFMSGNSTRLGVGIISSASFAAIATGLIVAFVSGVVTASIVSRGAGVRRRAVVLTLVALSLALAAGSAQVLPPPFPFALVAFAMGAENVLFEENGEVRIGLTYMTGTLVKIGQRVATALLGGDRWGWFAFLLLWLGLIAGAAAGAAAFVWIGLGALWIAAAMAAAMAVYFWEARGGI